MLERHFFSPAPAVAADTKTGAAKGPESGELKALGKANAELSRQCATLEATAQRYRTLFNSIDAGFCIIEVVFDAAGTPVDYRFVEVNSAFEEQTGLNDAAGKSVRELVPGHEQHWFQIYGHVALSGQPIRFQNRAGALNRWYDAYAFRVGPAQDRTVGVLFTDITARKRAEEALAKTQQDLKDYAVNLENTVAERTARLRETVQELEAFSYSIAHDMRAPLRAMRGFASILEEEHTTRLDPVALSYLHRISNAASRLDQLILDILDYSKIVRDELRLAPLDLHKLVREILASYPQFDSSRVDIVVEGPLPVVLANNAAMTQVLSNILTNAVKFATPGVRPRVRIRAEDVRNDPDFPNGAVRLWVEDNGIGIPARAQSRLFEIFTRFEDAALYEGTGIGLAIVKKAVERMRGSIGVESERGKGSRFWVQLHRPSNVPHSG
jgi:PAS domain S-box-containing protein